LACILGLKVHGHDTGAAIVRDSADGLDIVAISEARLDRIKHSYAYPLRSIAYCLESFGLDRLDQVDLICIDRHNEIWPEENSQFGLSAAGDGLSNPWGLDFRKSYSIEQSLATGAVPVEYVNHVDCHAAAAFYLSGFDEAAVLVMEGGQGIYRGSGTKLSVIDRAGYNGPTFQNGKQIAAQDIVYVNPSFFYESVTTLMGFDLFAGGKTMALAAYGEHFPRDDILPIPAERLRDFIIDYKTAREWVVDNLKPFDSRQHPKGVEGLIDAHWVNIARQTQEALYEDMLYLAVLAQQKSGSKRLCLGGGTALSCVTNRRIIDSGHYDEVFIPPAASDEGNPLGAALLGYYKSGGKTRTSAMQTAYFGRSYSDMDVPKMANRWGFPIRRVDNDEIANLLVDGKIIGRFAGKCEYGPRALGNRSILADPRQAGMNDRVNREIKHREGFRPFAPSCVAEAAHDYFDQPFESPFMIVASQVRPDKRDVIPAVTHVDGSSRVQTVRPDQNPAYYRLLTAFGQVSGVPVLLNTSFNDDGEPIVETPIDALRSFLTTGLDFLVIEDWLVSRPKDPDAVKSALTEHIRTEKCREFDALITRFCDPVRYQSTTQAIRSEITLRGAASAPRTQNILAQAISDHQAGRLPEAEQAYRSIIKVQPWHPEANHNIGTISVQVGKPELGLPHFKIALEVAPTRAQFWLGYINGLLAAGRQEEASQVLTEARKKGLAGPEIQALSDRILL
jgi:carbamoyltransferase